jgi:predicted DNA binding CopG/RHH family protein
MAKRKDVQKDLDRLAELAKGIPPERLEKALRKSRLLTMRVSETDHEDLKKTASKLGLTVTDYLLRLHYLASEQLKGRSRR